MLFIMGALAVLVALTTIFLSGADRLPFDGRFSSNDITDIKSVTYYDFPYFYGKNQPIFLDDFKNDAPKIRANGFNTVWFIAQVSDIFADKKSDKLNMDRVNAYREALEIARENNLKVILPLSYGTRQPRCHVLTDHQTYLDYVKDHKIFLEQIQGYAPDVYIVVFTESVWGCSKELYGSNDYSTHAGGERLAKLIKPTLGNLPNDLPRDLRKKFIFGFNDDFIAGGWNKGTSAVASPSTYDFISTESYPGYSLSDDQIKNIIDTKVSRIRSFYPNIPIMFGEIGSSSCTPSGASVSTQARVDTLLASYLIEKNIGLNVWIWKPNYVHNPGKIPANCKDGGLSITYLDGSLKPAAQALKDLFTESNTKTDPADTSKSLERNPKPNQKQTQSQGNNQKAKITVTNSNSNINDIQLE